SHPTRSNPSLPSFPTRRSSDLVDGTERVYRARTEPIAGEVHAGAEVLALRAQHQSTAPLGHECFRGVGELGEYVQGEVVVGWAMNFQDTDVTVDVCGQLFVHGEAFPSGRGLRGRNGDEVTAGFGPPDSSGCLITGVAHPLTTARMASVTVMSNEIDTTVPPSGDG